MTRVARVLALVLAVLSSAPRGRAADAAEAVVVVGSDTVSEVVRSWGADLAADENRFEVRIQGTSSSDGPLALVEGEAALAPMSRPPTPAERMAFRRVFGRQPLCLRVAFDAVRVFVHESNPLSGLSLSQLDALFSASRRCSEIPPVVRWEDLGVDGDWGPRKVVACGRSSRSGTHAFFRERVLCDGRFRSDLISQPGAASVAHWVRNRACGIGYGGSGGSLEGLRVVPIAAASGGPWVEPSEESVYSGTYPLHREVYVCRRPDLEGESAARADRLLGYGLSDPGQERVREVGLVPLPMEELERERQRLVRLLRDDDDD